MLTAAVRGAALGSFVAWYADTHGRAGLERAFANVPPGDLSRLDLRKCDFGIAAADWYPASVVHRMLDGLLDGLDDCGRSALAQSAADGSLTSALDGYLGIVCRAFMSPWACALVGPRLWRAFYSSGNVSIVADGNRSHVMTVRGWDGHHDFLCEMNNAAGRAIYRAAGCRSASTEHAACTGRGDRNCTYVIRW